MVVWVVDDRDEKRVNPIARTNADFRFHLAAPTVRTFELVYSGGRTDILLSAETVEDMRKYAGLLSLVYGGMKFESAEPHPDFLRELPSTVGLTSRRFSRFGQKY